MGGEWFDVESDCLSRRFFRIRNGTNRVCLEFQDVARLHHSHLDGTSFKGLLQFLRRALQRREGAIMNRDDMAALEKIPGRKSGVSRIHGKMATNRQQGQVRLVIGADQLHVGENPRIAGMVELETVFEFNDIASRLTAVVHTLDFRLRMVVYDAGTMFGMNHGHRNARERLDRTALVEADQLRHR